MKQPELFGSTVTSFFENEQLARIHLDAQKQKDDGGYCISSTGPEATEVWFFYDKEFPAYKEGRLRVARSWGLRMTKEEEKNPYETFVKFHRKARKEWEERKRNESLVT